MMTYTITKNAKYNSLEISFPGKPSAEVREALKALRFRWNGKAGLWYGYATEEATRAAIEGKEAPESAEKPQKAAETPDPQDHIKIYYHGPIGKRGGAICFPRL